jgi:hypothetical protein
LLTLHSFYDDNEMGLHFSPLLVWLLSTLFRKDYKEEGKSVVDLSQHFPDRFPRDFFLDGPAGIGDSNWCY